LIRLLPEKEKASFLNFLEKLIIRAGVTVSGRWRRQASAITTWQKQPEASQPSCSSDFPQSGQELASL
jgi:hypothetical protein